MSDRQPVNRMKMAIVFLVLAVLGLGGIVISDQLPKDSKGKDVLRDVSVTLLIAGVVGFGFDIYIKPGIIKETGEGVKTAVLEALVKFNEIESGVVAVRDRLDDNLNHLKETAEGVKTAVLEALDRFDELESGVVGVRDSLSNNINDHIKNAKTKTKVRILQTWFANCTNIKKELVEAFKRKCEVEVLLLHPMSQHAIARSIEYSPPDEKTPDREFAYKEIIQNIRNLHGEAKTQKTTFPIWLYDGTPVFSLYEAGNWASMGVFWRGGAALACPQIEFSGTGYFKTDVDDHFSKILNGAHKLTVGEGVDIEALILNLNAGAGLSKPGN